MQTIVALSSGQPPAAIGIIRVSGTGALAAATALVGTLPPPRTAGLRTARDAAGAPLDRLLVLFFPGPASATGEDLVELHCHGGRATVEALLAALLARPDVRRAAPGEFTRRALTNGRIDLAQAEGLADLLSAETEAQRRLALGAAEGRVSGLIRGWLDRLAAMAALVEAAIDFAEEGDLDQEDALLARTAADAAMLRQEIGDVLAAPPVERVRDGLLVVIGGPPNAGKSTLLNLLSQTDAAIVSPVAGTTRDRVEVAVRRGDLSYRLIDTAGLTATEDTVERIGVERATQAIARADLLIWLGDDPPPRSDALWIHARADMPGREVAPAGRTLTTRADHPSSIDALWLAIDAVAATLVPRGEVALAREQREACSVASSYLEVEDDPLIMAEQLRLAGSSIASVLGLNATETMLDALFSRFCLGK